jgi:two-component system phosphate regulon sensor histidine kinase PhoR
MIASGYLHAMNKDMIPAEQLATIVETVTRNVDQIATLTNDLLFLQEMELVLPEFQPVDITAIVDSVIKKYEGKAQARQVGIKVKGNRSIPNVHGDAQSLERALTALIDNAIKFSSLNGEVIVSFLEREEWVEIAVQDHGIGIDPEIRPRIFDRFVHLEKSGDELYGGLGIGLSITRQVIQQHKGSLNVESTPGKGSTFTISLLKQKKS